jgi:hypothetical protein
VKSANPPLCWPISFGLNYLLFNTLCKEFEALECPHISGTLIFFVSANFVLMNLNVILW